MDNGATASLYRYTPHFSGNQHFDDIFIDWFGSISSSEGGDAIIAIDNRYTALGGSSGLLGTATSDAVKKNGNGYWMNYQNGAIIWSRDSGAWESMGPIRTYWGTLGYQVGKMGFPTGAVLTSGGTTWQHYQNGVIVGSSGTGYWESKGSIREYWAQLGYQSGKLGYPIGPEVKTSDGGFYQKYEHGYIIGRKDLGYWESMSPIRDYWATLGYQKGQMGYPTGAIVTSGAATYQHYQTGVIIGKTATGYWESKGSIRKVWASYGYQTGALGFPTGPETLSHGIWKQNYEHGSIQTKNGAKYKVTIVP
jgi:uncharacterized protein with LGFP repeats